MGPHIKATKPRRSTAAAERSGGPHPTDGAGEPDLGGGAHPGGAAETGVLVENSHPFKTSVCVKLPNQPVIYAQIDFLTLTAEIVRTSVEDPTQEYGYLDLYQRIFWSQTNELERAISVYAAGKGEIEDSEEIRDFLTSKGFEFTIGEFERGLEYLILCQLLTKTPNNTFRVKPQYFARTLFDPGYTVDDWIDYLRDMWQQE